MNELALFAGAGGGILASKLLGWNTIGAVEIEDYPRRVLLQRQEDGILPIFPIWDDVCTFDGRPWKRKVDILTGGFPCQDISPAKTNNGGKALGIEGEKSGLWKEYKRIIGEIEPPFVFAENSSHLRTKGLVTVLKDLDEMGYNARWCVLGAGDFKANHQRDRMWILAYSNDLCQPASFINDETQRLSESERFREEITYSDFTQCKRRRLSSGREEKYPNSGLGSWWKDTSYLDGMDDGVAHRMDRLKAIGNGQVPLVAAGAFKLLSRGIEIKNV